MPDGSIILMGGTSNNNINGVKNDVWRSTDNGKTWNQMTPDAGWSPRYDYSSVVMPDGSIVLMGGLGGSISVGSMDDVWRSTDNGKTWKQMTPDAGWSPRYSHSSVAMPDGSIVLTGGIENVGKGPFKNDVWRSTDYGKTWNQMTPRAGWSIRCGHASIAMPNGSIVLMGGNVDGSISSLKNDIWQSTDNGASWIQMNAGAGWTARSSHASVAMPDGSIVLMGGGDNSASFNRNDVWRIMPAGSL
jgi:photosystem II stability/assembly factor-like uncharacterized protein